MTRGVAVIAACVLMAAGCEKASDSGTGGEAETTQKAQAKPSGKAADRGASDDEESEANPVGDAPAAEVSKFAESISPRDVADAEETFAGPLRWDFSGGGRYRYALTQKMESPQVERMNAVVGASLVFEAKGKSAKVVRRIHTLNGRKLPTPKTRTIAEDYRPDGAFDINASKDAAQIPLSFPVPEEPLEPGKTASVAVQFPLRLQGEKGWLRGEAQVTLERLVDLEGALGAELSIDMEMRELPEGEFGAQWGDTYLTGSGLAYFNLEAGRYESGEIAYLVHMDFRDVDFGKGTPNPIKDKGVMVQHHLVSYEYEPAAGGD